MKAKPPLLDKEQDWQEFKFKMKILGSTMAIESEMDEASATVADASENSIDDNLSVGSVICPITADIGENVMLNVKFGVRKQNSLQVLYRDRLII